MTDLNPEGLERAAEAIAEESGDLYWCTRVWEAWGYGTMDADDFTPISDEPDILGDLVRAAVTAYLEHALPVVYGLPALWHLPDATILRDAEGVVWEVDSDDEAQWACVMGHEDGYPREDIHLPARVIWWGDQ